jgi:hypothetical protein
MSNPIVWSEESGFAELAKQAQHADFSNDIDAIRAVPEALLERARSTASVGPDEEAAAALDFLNKVTRQQVRELGDRRAALRLKQVVEACIDSRGKTAFGAAMELQFLFNTDLVERMNRHRLTKADRNENPMAVIEQCYFGEGRDSDDHLIGGYWLTVYRTAMLVHSGDLFGPVLFALREAYAYTLAGEEFAAESAANWALKHLESLAPAFAEEQRDAVAQLLQAVAVAERTGGDQAGRETYLKEALKYAPQEGDLRADLWFDLSDLYQKQGRIADSLRACEQGRRVRGVTDSEIQGMLETQWTMLRAEFEGAPERMKIDERALGEFGGPADFNAAMQAVMRKQLAGEKGTDDELNRAIQVLRAVCAVTGENKLPDRTILSQHLLMLGMALTMDEPQRFEGCSPTEILAVAEKYLGVADEEGRLRLEMLRNEVRRRGR